MNLGECKRCGIQLAVTGKKENVWLGTRQHPLRVGGLEEVGDDTHSEVASR